MILDLILDLKRQTISVFKSVEMRHYITLHYRLDIDETKILYFLFRT